MRILGYHNIAKSSAFLLQADSSVLCFSSTHLKPFTVKSIRLRHTNIWNGDRRMHCEATSLVKPPTGYPLDHKNGNATSSPPSSKSLYARPSLRDMQKERELIRLQVYEFLRKLGIVPDELDGLELPVTVEVMRERVDFLHSLGLTIEDINNYPLVLGCSVKKNMIPVLDYLGKLGVRKSTITDFLRRYPQVLHASVVVDLTPVVKYLKGLDIKPIDIPRVLEKYPEVLGFKLEGTMSTSVAYLVGIGVARRQISTMLTRYPMILGMRVARVIKPFVEFMESMGIPRLDVARIIENHPYILGFDLRDRVKYNVEMLMEFSVRRDALASLIMQYPEILGIDLKPKLLAQKDLLESTIQIGADDFGTVVEKMPRVVNLGRKVVIKHVDYLKSCGFSVKQICDMVVSCPQLLALNLHIMKLNFLFFQEEMERDLEDLVAFPAFFTYGLESTIKPRHKIVSDKGLKCSLRWLLNCTDAKFEERMSYDSISIEDMEPEPSFGMKGIMEPSEGKDFDTSDIDALDSEDEDHSGHEFLWSILDSH